MSMTFIRMRLRRLDVGLLLVVAICLVALWPFIGRNSLPQGTDAELHVFRLAELARLVEGGILYPRWAPNFYYAYGYPIFNYYAPLTYYLALPFAWLVNPVFGVKMMFVLGLLGGALGLYGFVRDNWGRPAGLVAAALFVYAPYLQYVDPHARGVMPETVSFAVFALTLWALDRFRRRGTAAAWGVLVIGLTAVVLTHNLMALVFGAFLFGWFVWQVVAQQVRRAETTAVRRRFALFGAAAFALGVGMAAFFWLPLLLERDAVNLTTLVAEGSHYDYRNHFLSLRELLGPSLRLDWGASEPVYALNLGVVQWVLGGVGVALWALRRTRYGWHTAFFVTALAVLVLLMLPVSQPVWQALPLLPFLQFPWRLLGASVAVLAVLGGIATDALLTQTWLSPRLKTWLAPLFVGATLLVALPLSQVRPWDAFGPTEAVDGLMLELEGRWLGTTSTADFVPATVEMVPREEPQVLGDFWEQGIIERLNRATLPESATVMTEIVTPLHFRYTVDSAESFLLRLFLFAFPGWETRIDGEQVPYELGTPEGFITVPVEAGQHVIDVRFGTTAPRQAGWVVAAVSLLLAGAGVWWLWRAGGDSAESPAYDPVETRCEISWRTLGVVAALTLSLAFVLEPAGVLYANSAGLTVADADQDVFADFGGEIALIGIDAPRGALEPGDTVPVTLYWKALRDLDANYQVFVHILQPDNNVASQSDKLNPGDFPTERWPLDKYVRDMHTVTVPQTIAPGEYALVTGLWRPESGRLPLQDGSGDLFVIRPITIAGE